LAGCGERCALKQEVVDFFENKKKEGKHFLIIIIILMKPQFVIREKRAHTG